MVEHLLHALNPNRCKVLHTEGRTFEPYPRGKYFFILYFYVFHQIEAVVDITVDIEDTADQIKCIIYHLLDNGYIPCTVAEEFFDLENEAFDKHANQLILKQKCNGLIQDLLNKTPVDCRNDIQKLGRVLLRYHKDHFTGFFDMTAPLLQELYSQSLHVHTCFHYFNSWMIGHLNKEFLNQGRKVFNQFYFKHGRYTRGQIIDRTDLYDRFTFCRLYCNEEFELSQEVPLDDHHSNASTIVYEDSDVDIYDYA